MVTRGQVVKFFTIALTFRKLAPSLLSLRYLLLPQMWLKFHGELKSLLVSDHKYMDKQGML